MRGAELSTRCRRASTRCRSLACTVAPVFLRKGRCVCGCAAVSLSSASDRRCWTGGRTTAVYDSSGRGREKEKHSVLFFVLIIFSLSFPIIIELKRRLFLFLYAKIWILRGEKSGTRALSMSNKLFDAFKFRSLFIFFTSTLLFYNCSTVLSSLRHLLLYYYS